MKPVKIRVLVGLFCCIARCCCLAENAPPQSHLKTFSLHGAPLSADISPDERSVATVGTRSDPTDDPSKVKAAELVQVWDFQNDKLIAETILHEELREKRDSRGGDERAQYVRYFANGQLIIAYSDHWLHVLQASDLHPLKRIHVSGPPDVTRTFTTRTGTHTVADKGGVTHLELSPAVHLAALVWVRGFTDTWVEIVDFDSGKQTVWNTKDRNLAVGRVSAISWTYDGRQLVVAVPSGFACGHNFNGPDVFAVDPLSGDIKDKLSTGLLLGDIAVTEDGRVLAVDSDCVGVVANHRPPMKVFDLHTGKKLDELSGRGSGVRYAVSASRSGHRAVAYTGIVNSKFDWGDMVPLDQYIDWTFTSWDISDYRGLVTSQQLENGVPHGYQAFGRVPLRISPKGGFVLQGANIYQLP